MDVLGQMQLFARVVELGGFTAAARDLGVPKSTVSRQVARLEDRLGVRLIHRNTRSLSTTEAGQAYFERCSRILAEVADAESSVTQAQSHVRGNLRLTAPVTFGYLFLGELIATFLRRHPDVHVEVALADRRVDLIEEGFDLAIRIGALDDSTLVARRLGQSTFVIAGSPEYLERRGVPASPTDLRDHDCFTYEYGPPTWRFGELAVPVRGPLHANNGDILRAAAVAGAGLVYGPRFIVADELRSGRLVTVLDAHLRQGVGVWAIYPANRHLTPKVRAFVDHAAEWAGDAPPWER